MKKAFGLVKSHGDYKGLDTAIVKATNFHHALPKEKHIRHIFSSLSPSKPRSEVAYCIHSLARRLNQTNNWAVVLKTLIILHRAMRELDTSVWEELINYSTRRGYLIDLSHFHDTSIPNALDYSCWIRNYGLYLGERLRCFVIVHHDVAAYTSKYSQRLDTKELLEQLPALQNLLFRLLDSKPGGASAYNRLIQYALSIIASESVKIYVAITVRVVELLEKFFEMNHDDAISALKIYKKSGSQAERLSEFFETCRGLDFGRGHKFINIKQPPASFITTMEEYIKEAPNTLMIEYNANGEEEGGAGGNKDAACVEGELLSVDESDPSTEKSEATAPTQAADLMGLYDLLTGASEFDENPLALAIVPTENSRNSSIDENEASPLPDWEVALFTDGESSPDQIIVSENKEGDEVDMLKLEGFYNEANGGAQHEDGVYRIGQVNSNPFDFEAIHDPTQYNMAFALPPNAFCVPPNIPTQFVNMHPYHVSYDNAQQQQQEEPFTTIKKSTNPFDDEPDILPPPLASDVQHQHPTQTTSD
ncbi:putative clathrin assembly protein At5g35200 [Trifolium pratense]|uniref:putative clathrin assembly protein At5g35200 n=1 Tax=Trifolium pratense TaxID=57577 RepID=UPI001E693861|nr:putative clathrin assembly protein At5g35200 [Trifolium pratense]